MSADMHQPPTALPLRSRAMALLLAWTVLALGVLAASPQLHAAIHGHNVGTGDSDHACAVTLFAAGVETLAVPPAGLVFASQLISGIHLPKATATATDGSRRLPPICGPPRA